MAKYYAATNPAFTGVQVGTIAQMPKDDSGNYFAPDGWMECNGRDLNPNEYLGLYQIIGNTYGGSTVSGDYPSLSGSFKVPDLRDRKLVGTGRLRPDGSSPQLEAHDGGGSSNIVGTTGGKNTLRLNDIAARVQVVQGSVQSTFNTSRTAQTGTTFHDGNLDVNTGYLSNYTLGTVPPHSHGTFYSTANDGGDTYDRTSPGGPSTGVRENPSNGPENNTPGNLGQSPPQYHSHYISWRQSILNTVSYHRGWGDSHGPEGQNSHLDGNIHYSGTTGYTQWKSIYCQNGDMANEGNISFNDGTATIKPTASQMQWVVNQSPVDGTQITFGLDVDLGLTTDPDIKPEFQTTAYMIFAGVSSSAYVAPPPTTGDNIPDQVAAFAIGVTTASADGTVTFNITGVDGAYTFDVEVLKTGGESVGANPINLDGTGTNVKTGYVLNDPVTMTLEAPSSGGTDAVYTINVKESNVTVMTTTATITYQAAPTLSLSAAPTQIQPSGSSVVTYSCPGATSITSNFGATTVTGGSVSVSPGSTTTYTMTATNAWGDTTRTVVVNVAAANAPIINMSVSPTSITAGETVVVSYTCGNADSYVAAGASPADSTWTTNADAAANIVSFSQSCTPTADTTYTVELSNANGNSTGSVQVTVAAVPLPTSTLTADINDIVVGNPDPNDDTEALLTWSTTGANTVSGSSTPTDSNWNPTTDSGNFLVKPDETTIYTLTATNASGSASASQTINVTAYPDITFTLQRGYVVDGSNPSYTCDTSTQTDHTHSITTWVCCEEEVTLGWSTTGTVDTITGTATYSGGGGPGFTVSGTSGTINNHKPVPTQNGNTDGGVDAVSDGRQTITYVISVTNSEGQTAEATIVVNVLRFGMTRSSDDHDNKIELQWAAGPYGRTNMTWSMQGIADGTTKYYSPADVRIGAQYNVQSIDNITHNTYVPFAKMTASNQISVEDSGSSGHWAYYTGDASEDTDYDDLVVTSNMGSWNGATTDGNTAATGNFNWTAPD